MSKTPPKSPFPSYRLYNLERRDYENLSIGQEIDEFALRNRDHLQTNKLGKPGGFVAPVLPPAKKLKTAPAKYAVEQVRKKFPNHATVTVYTLAAAIERAYMAGQKAATAKAQKA